MKMSELTQAIQSTYNKHFPNSKCFAHYTTNLYRTISIGCYLAADKSELSNGYWDNDMLHIKFMLETDKGEFSKDVIEESETPDNLVLEVVRKNYFIKPSGFNVYDSKVLPYRKTKGNAKKIIATLDKYFTKLKPN